MKIGIRGFSSIWLQICRQIFKIQNDSSYMAVPIWRSTILKVVLFVWKSHENLYKVGFWIADFEFAVSTFRNISKFYENLYMRVFGDADYESAVGFWKFKMRVPV